MPAGKKSLASAQPPCHKADINNVNPQGTLRHLKDPLVGSP